MPPAGCGTAAKGALSLTSGTGNSNDQSNTQRRLTRTATGSTRAAGVLVFCCIQMAHSPASGGLFTQEWTLRRGSTSPGTPPPILPMGP
eukprot:7389538-Prymnesium_polylepis.1